MLRKANGLGQVEFAKKIGISSGYMSELEQGNKSPGAKIVLSLSNEFGVNPNWLLTGEGEMLSKNEGSIVRESGQSYEVVGHRISVAAEVQKAYLKLMRVIDDRSIQLNAMSRGWITGVMAEAAVNGGSEKDVDDVMEDLLRLTMREKIGEQR